MSAEDSELDYSLEDLVAQEYEDEEEEEEEEEQEEDRMRNSQGRNNHMDRLLVKMEEDEDDDEEEFCEIEEKIDNTVKETASEEDIIIGKITSKKKNIFGLISRSQAAAATTSRRAHGQKSLRNNSNFLVYSRRLKSLEELSKRFLSVFIDKAQCMVSLDKITAQLGVERRRIYDIINILESLKLVSRNSKNNYNWNGIHSIFDTIEQYESTQLDTEQIMMVIIHESTRREKSLEMLSIGFLKLFLHWKKLMTLEEAAQRLSEKSIEENNIKTKIRRLYDIANVFKSLGLIQKTAIQGTKKPAFEWVGKKGVERFAEKIIGEKGGEIHEQREEENVQGNLIKPQRFLKKSMILQQQTMEQTRKGSEVHCFREHNQEKSSYWDENQNYQNHHCDLQSQMQVQLTPPPSMRMKKHKNINNSTVANGALSQSCCCCCCCCNSTGISQPSSSSHQRCNSHKIHSNTHNITPTQLLFESSSAPKQILPQDTHHTPLSLSILNNPLIVGSLVNLISQNSQENQQKQQHQIAQGIHGVSALPSSSSLLNSLIANWVTSFLAQYTSEQIHQGNSADGSSRTIGASQQGNKQQPFIKEQQQSQASMTVFDNLMKQHSINNSNGNMPSKVRNEYTNVDDADNQTDRHNKTMTTADNVSTTSFKINPVRILTQSTHTDRQIIMPPPPFKKSFSACSASNQKGSIIPPQRNYPSQTDDYNVKNDYNQQQSSNQQQQSQQEQSQEQNEPEQQCSFSQILFQQLLQSTTSSQTTTNLLCDQNYPNEETDKPFLSLKQSQSTQSFH